MCAPRRTIVTAATPAIPSAKLHEVRRRTISSYRSRCSPACSAPARALTTFLCRARYDRGVSDGGTYTAVKRLFLGRPIPTALSHHERLSRLTGLAVMSSDALSSVAYATEEILRVLVMVGAAALTMSIPIGVLIAALLGMVA